MESGAKTALLLARKGAHIVVSDMNEQAAEAVAAEAARLSSSEAVFPCRIESRFGGKHRRRCAPYRSAVRRYRRNHQYSGYFPGRTGAGGQLTEAQWNTTFAVNVTGNYLLARETTGIFKDQKLPASLVLDQFRKRCRPESMAVKHTTSVRRAVNHLIRELAVGLAPLVSVNGIAPATVVAGSTMFPRDRVMQSLQKYKIEFAENESTEELRDKLADFYAQRTLTRRPILPRDCARAIVWLAREDSAKTTGHMIPVDGGLQEAFLR